MKKLIDYMKVDEVPELPSRQDELKYLKWLETDTLMIWNIDNVCLG